MTRVDLHEGARNAVLNCLGVSPGDRFLIVGDVSTAEICGAMEQVARATGGECLRLELEQYVGRPAQELPDELAATVRDFAPTVSAMAIQVLPGEFTLTTPLRVLLVDELACRHAQMNGITRRMMEEGMAADYVEVAKLAERLHEVVGGADTIEVEGAGGTSLVARFSAERRWVGGNAIYREPGRWGNLPAGEVGTSPIAIEGVIATRVMGDVFGRYGLLDRPVLLHVRDGRFAEIEGPSPLREELIEYLTQTECAGRVGEFAIGCNTSLTELCGDLLQDEKFPGVHLGFGDPYPRETGADWSCNSHMDVVAEDCAVVVDGTPIMSHGRFLV